MQTKHRTIGGRIFRYTVITVCITLVILGTFSCFINYNSTMTTVSTDIEQMAVICSDYVEWELKAYLGVAEDLGNNPILSSDEFTVEEKLAVIDSRVKDHGLVSGNFADLSGNSPDGNNYSEREYFQNALQGKSTISEPTISKFSGALVMVFAAPILQGTEVKGAVFLVPDSEFLNDIMRNINISEGSEGYMLDRNGNTIASVDSASVMEGQNVFNSSDKKAYADIIDCHTKMCAGETGFCKYGFGGTKYLCGYSNVSGTNGWSVAVRAPENDFMLDTYLGIVVEAVFIVICLVLCGVSAMIMGNNIGKKIKAITGRMELLAKGDLKTPVPKITSNDETGILADAATDVVGNLNSIIGDIGRILGSMANRNFNISAADTEQYYIGDYKDLLVYMRNINHQLSATLYQISIAGDQVSEGADQVAQGATSLSQGAIEQSSSVEQLSSAVHTISEQVTENTNNCDEAKEVVHNTASLLGSANEKMLELSDAMQTISSTSEKISEIIKTIDDIAFQTNILALNAAVEAARAGEAGKGFSVVAEEVRNLSSKSAAAANNTTELIKKSVDAVSVGTRMTDETAKAMQDVQNLAGRVEELIDKIDIASANQNEMITQISTGMDRVSEVVQNTAATAEESAAASEELSGQSAMLKELIGTFTLREDNAS